MIITLLEPQKNDRQRMNVFVDGNFVCGLPLTEIVNNHLKEGQEITEKELEIIWQKSIESKLTENALNYLSYRPRSEKEVFDHLLEKLKKMPLNNPINKLNMPDNNTLISHVLEKLCEKNYVNDINFAKWWIEQRRQFKQKSKKLIEFELKLKGIGKDKIEDAWSGSEEKQSEEELALTFIKKKSHLLDRLPPKTKREKIYSWLAGRGFSYETIKNVIDTVLLKD